MDPLNPASQPPAEKSAPNPGVALGALLARSKRKILVTAAALSLSLTVLLLPSEAAKTVLKLAGDGWPSGHATPEGIACDLARSFINKDIVLLTNTCLRPFGTEDLSRKYVAFLDTTIAGIKAEATHSSPSPGGPSKIGKLYAARHLSKSGPASFGYAAFGFKDVMFVDVGVLLNNGAPSLNRTMVVQERSGLWYVHPSPTLIPLLSEGLNEEPHSTTDFTNVYTVEK